MIDVFWLLEMAIIFWVTWWTLRRIGDSARRRQYDRDREQHVDGKTFDWRNMGEHRRRYTPEGRDPRDVL